MAVKRPLSPLKLVFSLEYEARSLGEMFTAPLYVCVCVGETEIKGSGERAGRF